MIFFAAAIEIGSPYGVVGGATCCWVIWVLAWEAAAQTAAVTGHRRASTVVRRKAASALISSLLSDA